MFCLRVKARGACDFLSQAMESWVREGSYATLVRRRHPTAGVEQPGVSRKNSNLSLESERVGEVVMSDK